MIIGAGKEKRQKLSRFLWTKPHRLAKTGKSGAKLSKTPLYGSSRTVALRAAWAPITSTWAMSAVFEGPLMNVP